MSNAPQPDHVAIEEMEKVRRQAEAALAAVTELLKRLREQDSESAG